MSTPTAPAAGSSPAPAPTPAPTPAPATATPAPAPAAAPTSQTPPAAPAKVSIRDIMAKASPEERRQLAAGKFPAKPAAPAPAAPAAPVAQPAAATPPAAPAPGATPETPEHGDDDPNQAPDGGPSRFRFTAEQDRTIALMAKQLNISLADAADRYRGITPGSSPAPAAAAPAPAAAPAGQPPVQEDPEVAVYDQRAADIEAQVAKLTVERKKARDDLEADKADELSDKIADLRAELKLVQNEKAGLKRAREEAQQRTVREQVHASRARAYEKFPALADKSSVHHLALIAYIEQQDRPERASFFQSPDWPEKIAEEYAGKYGIAPAGSAPAAPPANPASPAAVMAATPPARPVGKTPQQVTAATNGARMLTGAEGNPPSAPRALTTETAKEKIRNDPEFRRAAIRALGGTRK